MDLMWAVLMRMWTTQVIPSAGVSSSASYEMLICAIINFIFNDNKMTENDCAKSRAVRGK